MAKADFPLSWIQKAWKNSLLTWNSLTPFQLCSLSLLVSFFTFFPFCLSPFDSITLSLSLSLLHLSLTPSLSFPWSSVTCQDFFFFAFFYHICLSSLCVCLHVCVCLRVSVFVLHYFSFFLTFPHQILHFFFSLSLTRYRFALPPWLTRAHTRTDAHIPFSLSVRLIWISTCLPALARCLPSLGNTAERRGGTPKAQPP